MGYFSWLTADSKKSIPNAYSGRKMKPVFLLQPGEAAIREENYQGYGVFGGVDAYVWLAERNLRPDLLEKIPEGEDGEEIKRDLGIAIDCGTYVEDVKTGRKFVYNPSLPIEGLEKMHGQYDSVQPEYGKTANDLIAEGTWVEKPMREVLCEGGVVRYPLKFSFRKNADYDALPASETCPDQGFFYTNKGGAL